MNSKVQKIENSLIGEIFRKVSFTSAHQALNPVLTRKVKKIHDIVLVQENVSRA